MLVILCNRLASINHWNQNVSYLHIIIYFLEFQLVDLSLLEIFEAVYVIEPAPFPVWEALISSFPKDHFLAIIKQVANSYVDNSQQTYHKMIRLVDEKVK